MKSEMFDKIVEARADERVQDRIGTFKRTCDRAYKDLLRISNRFDSAFTVEFGVTPAARQIFAILSSDDTRKGWPKDLWEKERGMVRAELLKTMDEMQKALIAAERSQPGENVPREREDDNEKE